MYRTDPIASNPFASIFISLVVSINLISLKFIIYYFYSIQKKNPPSIVSNQNGSAKEYNWSMPRLTPQEKFFVSQLISSPPKDVTVYLYETNINTFA